MNPVKTSSLVAGIITLWCAAASGQTFIPSSTLHVGNSPQGIAVITNYNGHGVMALVSANYADKTLTVLTNNGGGIFTSNTSYATSVGPVCLTTADVNGDGSPDLIYSSSDNDTLTVLTNNGSGVFGSNAVYNVPGAPYDFVAADVNGDGKPDLIVGNFNYSASEVTVLTNNGTGKFVSSGNFPCGGIYPRWITVADFNGDGKPDLAVADYDNNPGTLEIMTNSGTGTFVAYSSVAVAGYAYGVATADVNGDGKPDLISSSGTGGTALSVCTNNGNGTFTNVVNYTIGPSPGCVVVATNVNGDGKLELICVNNDNSLTVLTNNGSGLFAQEQNTPAGSGAYFIAVADVNGDGKPDLIIADNATNTLTILTNASISLNASLLPSISSFSPTNGMVGTNVVVTGTNFTGATAVYFNGTNASFIVNSNTQITATVPANAMTGPISVVTPYGTAVSTTNFMVNYPPLITSFSPTNGMVGTNVVITGANFTNATAVYFNGTNASFTVNSNSQITATVPANATTGPITVVTPYGTAVSMTNFMVNYPPLITGFSPTNGLPGNSVVITGANFTGANAVYFNGTNTSFTVNSNTQVTATVPFNATNGPITVVTPYGTAVSSSNFLVIYPPAAGGYSVTNPTGNFVFDTAPVVGSGPLCVTAADVNGDGRPDLITVNYGTGSGNTLTVVTNNGKAGFVSSATYTVGSVPIQVVAADVNGDGKADLISVNYSSGTLSVLTNNGSGTFVLSSSPGAGSQPIAVAAADVNGDGSVDLISANNGPGTLTVLTNNGGGGFVLSGTYHTGPNPYCVLAVTNLDGHGLMALISGNVGNNTLTVLTNNGSGGFGSNATVTAVGNYPLQVVAADVNGDGRPDLICADLNTNTLTVLTNNGSGVFGFNATYTVGNAPASVTAADVNGDGKVDLICANFNTNTLTVLTNNGTGGFILAATLTVGNEPRSVTAADINGDGGVDLICANYGSGTGNTLTVLTNTMVITYPPLVTGFSPAAAYVGTSVTISGANFINASAVYFNGLTAGYTVNSNSQITATVPANATTGPLTVVTPNGTAVSMTNFIVAYPPVITGFSPTNGIIGTSITITGTNFNGTISVYFNGTAASFIVNSNSQITATVPANCTTGPISVVTPYGTAVSANNFYAPPGIYSGLFVPAATPAVGNMPESVAVITNFNGLGAIALVSANYADKTLTVLTNAGGGIFMSNTSYATPVGPVCVAAADVNGDGRPDLIYSSSDNDTVTVLTNNGSGVFGSNAVYSVDGKPYNFAAADVNGDGRPDLIAAGYDTGYLTVLTNNNNGSGKFTLSGNFTSGGGNMRWVAVADFNGDGRPDVAVALNATSLVLVFTNNGGGTFNFASTVTVGGTAFGVTAADVNGDGKPDIITSGSTGANVLTVCTNNGNGTFTNAVNYTVGSDPTCVIAADVNGDGRPDLICADTGANTLTVLTNNGGGFGIRLTPVTGNGPSFVVAADVNGDGMPDLVTANTGTNTLTVLINTPAFVPAPVVTGFSPGSGGEGSTVTISGTNLLQTYSLSFNGVLAGFTIVSDSQINAFVPSCAGTGPIVLSNPAGTTTTVSNFTFVKQPITLVSPDETDLAGALCNNGYVALNFNGTITNTSTKVIASDVVLDGTGYNVTLSGNGGVGIFSVNAGVHLTLINLTLANGYATGGGAINNNGGIVSLANCTFTNNRAVGTAYGGNAAGGAILNTGTLTVNNSTFVQNLAVGANGFNFSGQSAGNGSGGGIYNNSNGAAALTNCTFYNDRAIGGNGGVGTTGENGYTYTYECGTYCCDYGFFGCEEDCPDYCTATVAGTPGGSGGNGGYGFGGSLQDDSGSMVVVNTTFAGGYAVGGSGGTPGSNGEYSTGSGTYGSNGYGYGGNIGLGASTVVFKNSLIANPVYGGNYGGNYWGGTLTDAGNNLCSDASIGFPSPTSLNNVNPNLGPLAANGGPTLTMALLPASPAIRAGTTNGAPATDQRGQPRKSLQIDMGAYETPVTPSSIQSALMGTKTSGAGLFKVAFTNTPGTSFSLWSATNLMLPFTNWTLLGFPRETTPGQFQFSDPNSTNNPLEFYRVTSP